MRTEFRNRIFLPIVLPLAIVLGIAVLVLLFAAILLWNTREAAIVIALVAAGGVLFAISMASSQERLEGSKRVAVVLAGLVPVLVGGIFAIPGVAGVDESELNINAQPHAPEPPEGSPLLAAENADTFCLPQDGDCEPTERWEIELPAEVENFAYYFDNRDEQTSPHNLALYELEGSEESPERGAELFAPDVFDGPEQRGYVVEEPEIPDTFFFQCDVHPNMRGVGIITSREGGE